MLRGFIFQKTLQAINGTMNSFEWEQNEHKILAFVVCLFPKNTLNWGTCLNNTFWRESRMKKSWTYYSFNKHVFQNKSLLQKIPKN